MQSTLVAGLGVLSSRFNAARGNFLVQYAVKTVRNALEVFQCRTRQFAGAIAESAGNSSSGPSVSMPHAAICWCNLEDMDKHEQLLSVFQCRTRQFAGAIIDPDLIKRLS